MLLQNIVALVSGYITIRLPNWDVAFAAKNDKGYINVKVRHHEYDKFVTFGYVDVAGREVKTNPWCQVRDPDKIREVTNLINQALRGERDYDSAPNPRGKPPGAKSTGGYRKTRTEAPRTEYREAPRTEAPTGDIAGMVAALQAERDNLTYKVAAMEKQLADMREAEQRAYQRGKAEAEPSNFRQTSDGVMLDGKAGKVFKQAVGEYKVGNIQAAANMVEVVMRLASL